MESKMKKKFEYFLNAVHYYLYLEEIWSTKIIEKGVLGLFHGLSVLLNFERFYEKKMEERRKNKDLHEYFYGKESGQSISLAHHWFGFFYSGYPCFLSFILVGIHFRLSENVNVMTIALAVSPPILLFYIPAYRAVFSKDRYLEYFKQFEKEDEQWHKKWKWITIAFCVGSTMTSLLGICAAWGILLL